MAYQTDIDIDFADREKALSGLPFVPAMIMKNGKPERHVSGVYFHDVPVDPLTSLCALPYQEAEERGWFKIDFLNNTIYEKVRDPTHLDRLLAVEPDWTLLENEGVVSSLTHIHSHFDVVRKIRPKCVEDLAVVLALIRPGKRHLLGSPRSTIEQQIWEPDQEGYTFKRAHALAYAMGIVVQLNLLCETTAAELGIEFFS